MFTENGLMIDLADARTVVARCDVFAIGFRLFRQRLLVDTRWLDDEGPLVTVVEPVASVEERFFWLGQKRPRLGPPQRFTFFLWPHSIAFLESCGIIDAIRQRCQPGRWPQLNGQIREALAELTALERKAIIAAITGRNHHTLWSRS